MLIEVDVSRSIMEAPVLVTGFEPFGNHLTNVSGEVALSVAGETIRNHVVKSIVLPVDERGSKQVANMLKQQKFAAIIHIGLAENAEWPRIEIRAKDELNFRIPDNSGRKVQNLKINGTGDLFSTITPMDWDLERMIDSPRISDDAGEFLCNETLYRTLNSLNDNTPCFFLHIPLTQKDATGLVLECIDRMLRPPCLDVGAGAIIHDGQFLAARRAPNEKHAGWWEFPGGKFEAGEDAAECLVREIREELELEVEIGERIGTWIFDHGDVVVRLHVLVCRILSGELTLHVHDQIKWCTGPDEVNWLGPDREIAEAISAR